jgi:hypothetical protein
MNARIAIVGIWVAAPLLQCRTADAVSPDAALAMPV